MAGLDVDPTSPMDDTSNMNSSPGLSCFIYLMVVELKTSELVCAQKTDNIVLVNGAENKSNN